MKKKKDIFVRLIASVWFLCLVLLLLSGTGMADSKGAVSWEQFSKTAAVNVNEDKVGAKVALKEAIHGTSGITYRYILKTDCPNWDYEDRYVTRTPISWATDDTAAVEVLVYDAQVRYEGTLYAHDTYYMVPLFGNLSSEDVPLENWKESLVKQAYMAYASDTGGSMLKVYMIPVFVVTTAFILFGFIRHRSKKKKEDPTEISDR